MNSFLTVMSNDLRCFSSEIEMSIWHLWMYGKSSTSKATLLWLSSVVFTIFAQAKSYEKLQRLLLLCNVIDPNNAQNIRGATHFIHSVSLGTTVLLYWRIELAQCRL